jgi:hypothetical protein
MRDVLKEAVKMIGQMLLFLCFGFTLFGLFMIGENTPLLFCIIYALCFIVTLGCVAHQNIQDKKRKNPENKIT